MVFSHRPFPLDDDDAPIPNRRLTERYTKGLVEMVHGTKSSWYYAVKIIL